MIYFLFILCVQALPDCQLVINLATGLNMATYRLNTFNAIKTNCCSGSTTTGVTCIGSLSTSTVTQIIWSFWGLNGVMTGLTLPPSLIHLDLSWNTISGNLSFMTTLPVSLTHLDMNSNGLMNGTIPTLSLTLKYLDLHYNKLTGTIPTIPIGITSLILAMNQLVGDLPTMPSDLTGCELHHNLLTGTLTLNKPTVIYIDVNFITNVVISDISSLTSCNLGYNPMYYSDVSYLSSKCDLSGITLTRSLKPTATVLKSATSSTDKNKSNFLSISASTGASSIFYSIITSAGRTTTTSALTGPSTRIPIEITATNTTTMSSKLLITIKQNEMDLIITYSMMLKEMIHVFMLAGVILKTPFWRIWKSNKPRADFSNSDS